MIKKGVCLHAEMNILNEIMKQKRKEVRAHIAVSKKCCYMCELYIKFAQEQGYNIVISGTHRKIYNLWKLPDPTDVIFKSNFLSYALKELDQIIQEEIDSVDSDQIRVNDEEHDNLEAQLRRPRNIPVYE
jgi:hypothetical protein